MVFRDQFTKDDIKVYGAVLEKPGDSFPNAAKWYEVVSSQLAARFVLFALICNWVSFVLIVRVVIFG